MRGVVGVGERHAVGQAGLEQLASGVVGVAGGAYNADGRGLGDSLDPAAGVIGITGLKPVGVGHLGHAAVGVIEVVRGGVTSRIGGALELATPRAGRTGVIGQGRDIGDIGARAVDLDDLAVCIVLHGYSATDRGAVRPKARLGEGNRPVLVVVGGEGLFLLAGCDAGACHYRR